MSKIKLIGFSGEIPALIARLLPDTNATEAFNTRLDDGGLTPVRLSRFTHHFDAVPPAGYKTIYKNGDEWLGWEDDVYAVPGPVAQDRLYVFGDGVPKMRVAGVDYPLAVSAPPTALVATVTGTPTTPGTNVTRLYVYTNVTQFGEESEPSPLSNEADWSPGQGVTLSGFDTTMTAGRTSVTQRIYRSQTGSTGTSLYFIAERASSTANFIDDIAVDAINEALPSLNWNPPPDGLTGVISLPAGMMAGFVGKDLYFCEPYRPHAWPEIYVLTMDYPIVGLGAYGTTLVVMTEGNPYLVAGSAPENMQSQKLELNLPCINARGIQDMGYGVAYPSHDGLVVVANGAASVASGKLFNRKDWQALSPRTMVAGQFGGRYMAFYSYSDAAGNEFAGTIIFDVTGVQPFILRSDIKPDAFYYDIVSGELFYLDGGDVYSWDAQGQMNAMQFWKSKTFVLPRPTNFGVILIEADDEMSDEDRAAIEQRRQEVIAANQALIDSGDLAGVVNGAAIDEYPLDGDALAAVPGLNQTMSVSIFADDKHVATVTRLNRMARLPSGFLARKWAIAVSSDMRISQITMAGTGAELMEV